MDDLPEWLLTEVLLRLPFVALQRFKVVCKKWLSLISTDYFLGKYKALYASRGSISPRWAFVSRKYYDCSERHPVQAHELMIDLHSGNLKCPIPNRSNYGFLTNLYRIMGVSNGLVLYKYWWKGGSKCGVCNPVTRQSVALPPCISQQHHWRARDVWGFLTHMKDGFVTSFTVVRYGVKLARFEVFSSETGEWKISHAYNIRPDFLHPAPPTDLGGILHWIIRSYYVDHRIVAYDPRRINCPSAIRVIPLPAADGHDRRIGICGTHDGHLRYLEFDAKSLSVWVLNDYGCGDNWLLQHRATGTDILKDVHPEKLRNKIKLNPICFHPFDPDVVYLGCNHVFLSYNMLEGTSQVLKTFHARGNGSRKYKWRRAFCLVIPPLPPLVPSSSLRKE